MATPKEYVKNWQVGMCDLEKVHHSQVTRKMVEDATEPFVVIGLTETWSARTDWAKEELLKNHGDEPYHLHAKGNESLGKLLKWNGAPAAWPPVP